MAVYKRGYTRYTGRLTGAWTRFMVLPRYAWRKLYQQRLVLLLTMAAFVWPILCAGFVYLTNRAELLQGLDKDFRAVHPGQRHVLLDFHVRPGGHCGLPCRAGRAGPARARSGEQRAPAVLQPAADSLELCAGAAHCDRRHVVGCHVDSGSPLVRVPGRARGWLVDACELEAGCGRGRRLPSLGAHPWPGRDGQLRLREVENRSRGGQPRRFSSF